MDSVYLLIVCRSLVIVGGHFFSLNIFTGVFSDYISISIFNLQSFYLLYFINQATELDTKHNFKLQFEKSFLRVNLKNLSNINTFKVTV